MTGGTSGLGRVAAQRLVATGATVLMAARGEAPPGVAPIAADLSRLGDVRVFADRVEALLDGRSIDALVLNAGGLVAGRTPEGYDAVFVLNYLAHYLLIERLWARISPGGRIVATTSGTHDPAERAMAPSPRHANALWLARPELDPDLDRAPRIAAGRAYASAKLCVVLHARALAARPEAGERRIVALAYDPGPTPGTGLGREFPAPMRILWQRFPSLLRWILRRKANTIEDAGNALADLVLGVPAVPDGAVYAALRAGRLTWPPLSIHARRDDLMHTLEADSARLVAP